MRTRNSLALFDYVEAFYCLSGAKTPIVFEGKSWVTTRRWMSLGTWSSQLPSGGGAGMPWLRSLLGELSRTGEDDRDLGISHRQPGQHVGEPGAATRVGPKKVGVLSLDNHGGACRFRQPLHLERQLPSGKDVARFASVFRSTTATIEPSTIAA